MYCRHWQRWPIFNFTNLNPNLGTACQTEAVGCFAMRLDGKAEGQEAITWTRGCCIENIQCTAIHEDSEVNGISGMVDQMGCVYSLACFT